MELKRLYETFTDRDGQLCVRVPLAHTDRSATLYVEDFFRLLSAGVSANWAVNYSSPTGRGYVKVSVPGQDRRLVARLLTGAGPRQQVRYRNGNPLDLRTPNLTVQEGAGRLDYGEMLKELEEGAHAA